MQRERESKIEVIETKIDELFGLGFSNIKTILLFKKEEVEGKTLQEFLDFKYPTKEDKKK